VNNWEKEAKELLDFWVRYSPDERQGGFIGKMDGQGIVHADAPKGLVLNARILWTFSAAFRYFKAPEYLEIADRAYAYLEDFFEDPVHGGAFWSLKSDGSPLQIHKQTYGLSFYLYGLVEYYSATGREQALSMAKELFFSLEDKAADHTHGGYFEAFSRTWEPQSDTLISYGADKSTNTHLHILEAYSSLYRIWPVDALKHAIGRLICTFEEKIYQEGVGMGQFFYKNWVPVKAPISYGHDIETYWLLNEAAQCIGQEVKAIIVKEMPERALTHLDARGGMWNDDCRQEKHWWVQAEALVGFGLAFQQTGDKRYSHAIKEIWDCVLHQFKDKAGEWYWGLDKRGVPLVNEDKMGFWKCPYHHVRALLILSEMEVEMT
jgi:mannobiose 2-epimerase